MNQPFALQCPIPISDYPTVTLAHGGGGKLSQMLIERMFVPAFANPALATLHDGAILPLDDLEAGSWKLETGALSLGGRRSAVGRLAFSTDSYVISPRFFPGGDIGSLAVHGTVNDLAMCGARPLYLSAGFILEEGLLMEELWRIVQSMAAAARAAGVHIVTGDTKVVERGKGDGLFINTAGVGVIPPGVQIAPQRARPGDLVLINGPIANHGIAIMSVREGLTFETAIESDSAPLNGLVEAILAAGGDAVHVLRDPTRGGVASSLNEIAAAARVGIRLDEASIPVLEEVRGACEILGFDPLYVANEGKCLVIVAAEAADAVLAAMRGHPLGRDAAIIGHVVEEHPRKVFLRSRIGGMRVVDMLSGEQLPRIC
ncbi:MAG: hydrogenase expression/formation protein HypE [Anaerolineae bacterium]